MDLPILGATGPSGPNGGGHLAAIDKTYAVVLTTTAGDDHIVTMNFTPVRGKGGTVDLGTVKDFDPKRQAMENTARTVHLAHHGADMGFDAKTLPVIVVDEDGKAVVWRHVTSFEFLGEWDPQLKQLVVYTESHEREHAKKAA
jgi:hypothetical protein